MERVAEIPAIYGNYEPRECLRAERCDALAPA